MPELSPFADRKRLERIDEGRKRRVDEGKIRFWPNTRLD